MSSLNNLNLVSAVRKTASSPIEIRRQRLLNHIDQQIVYAQAFADKQPIPLTTRVRQVVDSSTGNRATVQRSVSPRLWFWSDNNAVFCNIKYANKPLPLNKKAATAIQCASYVELVSALQSVKSAVSNAFFDDAIAAMCLNTRKAFKRV